MNKDGVVTDAYETLMKTPAGKVILNYYEKSNTHDIYIKLSDAPYTEKKKALARTLNGISKSDITNGKIDFERWYYSSDDFEKNFQLRRICNPSE